MQDRRYSLDPHLTMHITHPSLSMVPSVLVIGVGLYCDPLGFGRDLLSELWSDGVG